MQRQESLLNVEDKQKRRSNYFRHRRKYETFPNTPPAIIEHLEVEPIQGDPEEDIFDSFFERLEYALYDNEVNRHWHPQAARKYMDDTVGYYWDWAWLQEEERAQGRYKPSYQTIRDRLISSKFPQSALKNRVLHQLYHPQRCETVEQAISYVKTLVKQWGRLRERNRKLARLDSNLLKWALFNMLPPGGGPELETASYDVTVSFPRFKEMVIALSNNWQEPEEETWAEDNVQDDDDDGSMRVEGSSRDDDAVDDGTEIDEEEEVAEFEQTRRSLLGKESTYEAEI